MPTDRDAGNGLATFSLHVSEDSSGTIAELRRERAAHGGLAALDDSTRPTAVDPETAARRFLTQALDSPAVPSLNAPVAAGTTSKFKTIGTETVPLTGTHTVKFRQTLHDIPVYGSLVTVELDDSNELVSLDSNLGSPEGVNPVASVSPAQALAAAEAAPDGYTPSSADVVPRLHFYFDAQATAWRLVYILEDVPVTLDRARTPGADGGRDLEPPRFVDYVVDAHDGAVVAVLPRTPSMTSGEEQTAVDDFGVERTFLASKDDDGHLVLRDPVHNVETYDFGFRDPTAGGLPGDAVANPPDWSRAAVSGHANAVAVSDFMHTVLKRNNIDDRGGAMVSTINCVVVDADDGPQEWHNAFWTGQLKQMVYGQVRRGHELRSLAANIDVVAHEMFHGVTDSTSRLEYHLQSGAMNESYSDIFGTIVATLGNEDPSSWDWNLGENLFSDNEPLRDLSDPWMN